MSSLIKFIYCCIVILFFSCKKEGKPTPLKGATEIEYVELLKYNSVLKKEPKILDISFDDKTIFKNKFTSGRIVYDVSLDSLKHSDISKREILFFATTKKESLATLESIEKNASFGYMDTIVNGVFNFQVKFLSDKKSMLRVAIEDNIFLKGDGVSKKMKIKRRTLILSLPVFVLDSTSIIGYKGDTVYYVGERMVKVKRKDSLRLERELQRKIDSMKRVLNNQ